MIMISTRRRFLWTTGAAAGALTLPRIAWGQAYPSRPIRIINAAPPGGPLDVIARIAGHWLQERLGQPPLVESRPGSAANVGTEFVARAPADGYTLLIAPTSLSINATLFKNLTYNFIRDIAP